MEMEEITNADSKADGGHEEERAEAIEMEVIQPEEADYEEETNVYSKLQKPSEDVYQTAPLTMQPPKQKTNIPKFRLFRALAAILSIVCLILLAVIVALATKLQTQSICPAQEDGKLDVFSVCSREQCMSLYPQRQVQACTCHRCGKGWIEFEGFCFFLSRERNTWSDSRKDCQSRGGDLAIVDQDSVKNFLSQSAKDLYWIGLRRSHSGVWAWIDQSAVGISNWSSQSGQEDCVYMDGDGVANQSWKTAKCSAVTYYICQKSR